MNCNFSKYFLYLLIGIISASMVLMHLESTLSAQQENPKIKQLRPLTVDPKAKSDVDYLLENQTIEETTPAVPKKDKIEAEVSRKQSGIEEVIRSQLADFGDQDFSKAYYANMSSEFQKVFSVDVFKAYVRSNPILFTNVTFNIENTTFHDVLAVVTGKLISVDGQEARIQYDLIQENGSWKIRSMNVKLLTQPPAPRKIKVTRPVSR